MLDTPTPGTVSQARVGWRALAVSFKLRVVWLLLLAAIGGAFLAAGRWPGLPPLLVLVAAGGVTAAGASAINQWLERDGDALMSRTRGRPLVAGDLPTGAAIPLLALAMTVLPALLVFACNPVLAGFFVVGRPDLRRGLYDLAQAAHAAEHRSGRGGRQRGRPERQRGGRQLERTGRGGAGLDGFSVDADSLLEPGCDLSGRLPARPGAHAAGEQQPAGGSRVDSAALRRDRSGRALAGSPSGAGMAVCRAGGVGQSGLDCSECEALASPRPAESVDAVQDVQYLSWNCTAARLCRRAGLIGRRRCLAAG